MYTLYTERALLPGEGIWPLRKAFVLWFDVSEKHDNVRFPTMWGKRFGSLFGLQLYCKLHNNIIKIFWELILWIIAISLQLLILVIWVIYFLTIWIPAVLFWFSLGVIMHMTKAISTSRCWNFWFRVWTGADEHETNIIGVDTKMLNICIRNEFAYEASFQCSMQFANNYLTNTWTVTAFFSSLFSILVVLNGFYKFVYYGHVAAKHRRRELKDIPLDLSIEYTYGDKKYVLIDLKVEPQTRKRKFEKRELSFDVIKTEISTTLRSLLSEIRSIFSHQIHDVSKQIEVSSLEKGEVEVPQQFIERSEENETSSLEVDVMQWPLYNGIYEQQHTSIQQLDSKLVSGFIAKILIPLAQAGINNEEDLLRYVCYLNRMYFFQFISIVVIALMYYSFKPEQMTVEYLTTDVKLNPPQAKMVIRYYKNLYERSDIEHNNRTIPTFQQSEGDSFSSLQHLTALDSHDETKISEINRSSLSGELRRSEGDLFR
jgi:hypothetical protein